METTHSISHAGLVGEETKTDIWTRAEASRYAINMLVLMLVMIPGSMAAAYAVNLGDWPFALVLFPSVFTLILILGLAPMRLIVYTAAFALLMNFVIFFAGALA